MSGRPARTNALVRDVLLITLYAVSGVFPNEIHGVFVAVAFVTNAVVEGRLRVLEDLFKFEEQNALAEEGTRA